jgi:HlyD family type I secretion membrane fusion protein
MSDVEGAELINESRNEGSTDFLEPSLVLGWSTILLVFGSLLAWSLWAPFEGAVLTSGKITVASNQQAIQHLEGGIVSGIYVREADKVETGQKLIALDGTATTASLQGLEARLFELLGREARLVSERDGVDRLSIRPDYTDKDSLSEIRAILAAQQNLKEARALNRSTQKTILNQKIEQLSNRITGMENEILAKDIQIELLTDEVGRYEKLVENGNAAVVRVLALKRDLARLEGEKDALVSEIAATRVQIAGTQSEILKLDRGFDEQVLSELRDVQTEIEELSEQRVALLDRKSRLDITAPRSGRVIGVKAHTIGGVVTPSEPIMFIVPEGDQLVAKVRVMLADIDQIHVGQVASLRFSAFNQEKTPKVDGEVTKISADSLLDKDTGFPYYEAVVEFPADVLDSDALQLLPGMPVEAAIRTESRSVLSYLVKPLTDSMAKTFREE